MTNELAELDSAADIDDDVMDEDSGTLEVLPPARMPDMVAITTLRDHVGAMRDAKFFAEGMCYTALVPDRFRGKPGDGAAAILFGAEVGLSPIASLRSIIVIHGQPGLEARTMKALLKAKGYRFKTHESTDDACDIEAWSPDGSESERCRFTMAEAVKAEWVPVEVKPGEYAKNSNGKLKGNMKYLTEPRNMLRAKATAVVCREIAPHILLGMPYSADELSTDWSGGPVAAEPVRVASQRRGVEGLRQALDGGPGQGGGNDASQGAEPSSGAQGGKPDSRDQAPGGMTSATRRKWLNRMFQLLNGDGDCQDRDDQLIVIAATATEVGISGLQLAHRDDLTDDQLRAVVTQFNDWNKAGKLGSEITEILNRASIEQMQAEETATAATEQE